MINQVNIHFIYALHGGIANVAANIIREQIMHDEKVVIVYVEYDINIEKKLKHKIELIPVERPKFIGQSMLFGIGIRKIFLFLKNQYPECHLVVHAHSLQTIGLFSHIRDIPIVCTIHGTHGENSSIRSTFSDYISKFIIRKLNRNKSIVCAVSKSVADHFKLKNGFELPVVYNGIYLKESKQHVRNKDFFIIGHIGNLSYAKGLDVTIRGYCEIPKNLREMIKLVIAGKEQNISEQMIHEWVKNEGIIDDVKYLGYIPDASSTILTEIDLLILASKNEGFSIAVIEAMALGIPVLATRVGGNSEIIVDGFNGEFIANPTEIANKVVRLYTDADYYNFLSINARETYYKNYTANAMYQNYYEKYLTVINQIER